MHVENILKPDSCINLLSVGWQLSSTSKNTLDEQDEVAQIITKYDLLAVPVVDTENVIQGIVTADDALDKIIPTAWKKRLPRFYH